MKAGEPMAKQVWLAALVLAGAAWAQPYADVQLPGRSYVNNGGFERGTEGWEFFAGHTYGEVVTDQKHSGQSCFKVTGVIDDYRYLNQAPVLLTPGKTYTMSVWMKSQGFKRAGDNTLLLNLTNYGWTKSAQLGPKQPDEDWTRYTVTFEAPTTAEQGGRPSYTLVIFWPIKSEGTVWIDDIQIEEGDQASDFTESYLGWGIEALESLRRARTEAEGLRKMLSEAQGLRPPEALLGRVDAALTATDDLAARLRQYAQLPVEAAKALPDNVKALSNQIASLGTLVFLSDPYRPLREVALPAEQPQELSQAWTCLQGERRAVALNLAVLGLQGEMARLVPSDLYDEQRGVRLTGLPWLTMHYAPPLRGHLKPWERHTDPLPVLHDGLWTLLPGQINQAVLVCDTARLLPGQYRGEVEIQSLTRQTAPRKVSIRLTVAPVKLMPLSGVAVCDIGPTAEYALDSIAPLELNTFSISAQWLMPVDETMAVDFARIEPLVRERLERCPTARFWLGFGIGEGLAKHLQQVYNLGTDDERFAPQVGKWTRAVVQGFQKLGVPPERLIFETVDEPGEGQRAEAMKIAKAIKAGEPKVLTHMYVTGFSPDDAAAMAMYKAHDIIAPAFTAINDQSVATLRKLGKQIWVYDCQNSGETFDPMSYYRLLPWLARRYSLDGWGHFSMLESMRGRNYEPWHGVAEQSLVYPDGSGGQVISRRWLAWQAGTQDYRALAALEKLVAAAKQANVAAETVQQAEKLLAERPAQALALAKPGREYFTGLAEGADAGLLERTRDEIAALAGKLTPAPLRAGEAFEPVSGQAERLLGHRLPWVHDSTGREVTENVTRSLVQMTDGNGVILSVAAPSICRVEADSTMPPYTLEALNDGLAMPGMKFETEHGWISGGAATEHWVVAKSDQPQNVRGVKVWWMSFYGLPKAYKLQIWRDDTWHDAPGYEQWRAAKAAVEEITMPPVMTDRVRVLQQAGGGNATFPNLMGMSEIEVLTAF